MVLLPISFPEPPLEFYIPIYRQEMWVSFRFFQAQRRQKENCSYTPTWSPVFKQLHSKPPSPSLSILYRSLQTYFYPAAVTTLIFHPLDSCGINVSNLDVLRHSQRDYVTSGTHFSSQYWQLTQVWVMINNNLAGGLTRYISSPDYKMPNKRSSAYSTCRMGRWKRPDLSCLSYTLCK